MSTYFDMLCTIKSYYIFQLMYFYMFTQVTVYIAKYTYDPLKFSPNDNPELELCVTKGDYVYIHGDMDEDGFYEGELLGGNI